MYCLGSSRYCFVTPLCPLFCCSTMFFSALIVTNSVFCLVFFEYVLNACKFCIWLARNAFRFRSLEPAARPFSIMLVKLAFNATRNSRIKPKNAKIMPGFFKKCHLNSKKCFVLFQTKRTNSYTMCSYNQQVILNICLFIKLGIRI